MKQIFATIILSFAISFNLLATDALKWAQLSRYATSNDSIITSGRSPRVVLMGNSITDLWPVRNGRMFRNNPDIISRGISGQTSSQMLLRFRCDVVALHPEMVVINAGTNDIALNSGQYNEDLTFGNIVSMAEIALANGITPVLSSILPASGFGWRPEVTDALDKIYSLNTRIKTYARENGLKYVDYFPALLNREHTAMDTALAVDKPAIHPNAAGYGIMEDILLKSLLPDSIFSGLQGKHHVQGIAVDYTRGLVYYSFTTRLVKTDLNGRLLGSVDGLTGHLGCLALNPDDGRLYASIEYKNDVIGVGIAGEEAKNRKSKFYIAIFEPDKITRPAMKATGGLMNTILLPEVAGDYYAKVKNGGKKVEHRYGCSGIDGIAFAPLPGNPEGKHVLYVAYGIYADSTRTDNDYQVLTCYDIDSQKKLDRYFVYTGNTSWGIQNLCYDPATNSLLAAVYKGVKKDFPNFSLFAIDLDNKAQKERLRGFDNKEVQKVLPLKKAGVFDEKTGTYGWHFKYGSTGLYSVGDGLFYISRNSSRPEQSTTIHLYQWTGENDNPFRIIK